MARLWKRFNGEPFMVNPHLGILGPVNPRKRRRRKNMAKGRSARHMAWVRSFRKKNPRRRHRRSRRNPYPVAGLALNPRRRHRRRTRRNPVMRYRRRRARRNPAILGLSLPPLQPVLYAGIGFIGTPWLEGVLSAYMPASITTSTVGKYAVRIGSVVGLSMIAKMVLGKTAATYVGVGGGAYVLVTAIKEFSGFNPMGLAAYRSPGMGAYRSLGAYRAPGLGAPAFGAMNTPASASSGAANVVAARFRRFQ